MSVVLRAFTLAVATAVSTAVLCSVQRHGGRKLRPAARDPDRRLGRDRDRRRRRRRSACSARESTSTLEVAPCRRLEDPSCPPGPADRDRSRQAARREARADRRDRGRATTTSRISTRPTIETSLDRAQGGGRQARLLADAPSRPPSVRQHERRDRGRGAEASRGLTVIDWNVYSRSHPEWFQDDGLHLLAGGLGGDGDADPPEARRRGIAVPPRARRRRRRCPPRGADRPYSARAPRRRRARRRTRGRCSGGCPRDSTCARPA